MGIALTPCVPVPSLLCVFFGGLRSGSWGHCLASELRTRADSPPSGWSAHFPAALNPLCSLLDGDGSCSLSPPPNPPFLLSCRGLGKERVSQIPGPAVSNINSQHPPETLGKSSGNRTSYIICRSQCKMNTRSPYLRKQLRISRK